MGVKDAWGRTRGGIKRSVAGDDRFKKFGKWGAGAVLFAEGKI